MTEFEKRVNFLKRRNKDMASPFTLGIEEEFQMVDQQSGQLSPAIQTILEKGHSIFGEQIKAEMLQSTVELISDIMPNMVVARQEMQALRTRLAQVVAEEGLALISAGTHPTSVWLNEPRSPYERYAELEYEAEMRAEAKREDEQYLQRVVKRFTEGDLAQYHLKVKPL